jgi:hypothetical protein
MAALAAIAGSRAVAATMRLRLALEGAAEALAHAQVEGLLASEGALEFALAELPPMQNLAADERDAVRRELEAAERALLRCRRLGSTLTDYVRLTLASHAAGTETSGYTNSARSDAPLGALHAEYAGRGVNARV